MVSDHVKGADSEGSFGSGAEEEDLQLHLADDDAVGGWKEAERVDMSL
jgi:hypothetical protein